MARFRSWWQKARKRLGVFSIVVVCMLMIALIMVIVLAYLFNVNVPGFRGKTLWDWMQLLVVPFALAIIAFLFNRAERKNEQRIASDNQQEASLQGYLDKMSELLLHEEIRKPVFKSALSFDAQNEAQHVARARTLTVLSKLDASRKRSVIQFLDESHLITKNECIVHLNASDPDGLNGADLSGASLAYSDLHKVNLSKANLSNTTVALFKHSINGPEERQADSRKLFLTERQILWLPGPNLNERVSHLSTFLPIDEEKEPQWPIRLRNFHCYPCGKSEALTKNSPGRNRCYTPSRTG